MVIVVPSSRHFYWPGHEHGTPSHQLVAHKDLDLLASRQPGRGIVGHPSIRIYFLYGFLFSLIDLSLRLDIAILHNTNKIFLLHKIFPVGVCIRARQGSTANIASPPWDFWQPATLSALLILFFLSWSNLRSSTAWASSFLADSIQSQSLIALTLPLWVKIM